MPHHSYRSEVLAAILVLLLWAMSASVVAQTEIRPDAGQILEQVRPPLPLPAAPPPAKSVEAPEPPPADGPTIGVASVRITGASVFAADALHALVADVEGQTLSLQALHVAADRITQYYRERGYVLAHAYVPAQQVSDGVLELAIVEGRIGAVTERNDQVVGGAALAPLAVLQAGEIARSQTLVRSLLLLSDLPGVVVTSTLKPGSTAGTSDLLVEVTPGVRVSGNVDVDGNGDRFTGRMRAGALINFNNPLRLGDLLTVRGRISESGLAYALGDYRLPLNRYGTRMGVSLSELHYRLGDALAPLGLEGEAHTVSLTLTHPLVRTRRMNINAQLEADDLTMQDRVTSTRTVIDRKIHLLSAGVSGNWVDDWGGSSAWSAEYTSGNLGLDDATAFQDGRSARAAGQFEKFNVTLRRLQGMTPAASLLLSFTGQVAGKNLDSSQKMGLGGASGVRAYPQGEGFGDQGFVATIELRHHLTVPVQGAWLGSVFVDHGFIEISKNPWNADPNTRKLTGGGLGLTAQFAGNWSVMTSLAWRLGADLPRNDIDRLPRGWVQVAKGF